MFTGIVETTGIVLEVIPDKENLHFRIQAGIAEELLPDQSVAHDGVCLTVTKVAKDSYWVTAIRETLSKTNLSGWKSGTLVNLERAMPLQGRLDGHFVQGHVDATSRCLSIQPDQGSTLFQFHLPATHAHLVVEKGSICINGVSLTCFNLQPDSFTVAIIPYTMAHTNFQSLEKGASVNLEFDLLGKYISRLQELKNQDHLPLP